MKKSVFPKITYADDDLDADMALCKNLRDQVSLTMFSQRISKPLKYWMIPFEFLK